MAELRKAITLEELKKAMEEIYERGAEVNPWIHRLFAVDGDGKDQSSC